MIRPIAVLRPELRPAVLFFMLHLAVVNTKLLADYAAVDGRLAQLVFVVKAWAKARNTNDAYRSACQLFKL